MLKIQFCWLNMNDRTSKITKFQTISGVTRNSGAPGQNIKGAPSSHSPIHCYMHGGTVLFCRLPPLEKV